MSELIAVNFKDSYRASEVLTEWQRREWDWAADLDNAAVVRLYEQEQYRVQFIVDPRAANVSRWTQLWLSFLTMSLQVNSSKDQVFTDTNARGGVALNSKWWSQVLGVSGDFVRDLGALVQPGDSAILMIIHVPHVKEVFQKLRNYGGTVLHTSFSAEQDAKLREALH